MMKLARELNCIERSGGYRKHLAFIKNVEEVSITLDDILAYKNCRREPAEKVQTALVIFDEVNLGLARMLQSILGSENNRTEVFRDMAAAAHWLAADMGDHPGNV